MAGVEIGASEKAPTTKTADAAMPSLHAAGPVSAAMPQALLSTGMLPQAFPKARNFTNTHTVQDQNVQNLMMSWYYAGYYTGLYEGQQKAYATMQESG